MKRAQALVLVAKAPEPGNVKTRLLPFLTPQQAAGLYRCFFLDRLDQFRQIDNVRRMVAYDPPEFQRLFRKIVPSAFEIFPQTGQDLGERLANIFSTLFSTNGCACVVVTDSDSPTLPTAYIQEAFHQLARGKDVVLGPAEDGGYYLIGLRRPVSDLFVEIPWSTSQVLAVTLARMRRMSLKGFLLPYWYDIDTPRDLQRLHCAVRDAGPGETATRTRAYLQHLFALKGQ